MKKNRLIPVLLLKNGFLVQSKSFCRYQNLGDPITAVKRLSDWASDELIYLDISQDDSYDTRREDHGHPNRSKFIDIIRDVSHNCFMPITVGGRIKTIEDIRTRLANGADKVCINTQPLLTPEFVSLAASKFGSQCIVVSVDVKLKEGKYVVMAHGGKVETAYHPVEWAKKVESLGAGEILLNSIDRDGMRSGYDIEMLSQVSDSVRIPVIAMGGVGEWEHFAEALEKTKVDAVAAANIFHYFDQSVFVAKKYLFEKNLNVRPPSLIHSGHGGVILK
ncbi:MAG: imidazole glycerol phosphate synthase subunit HisF [Candidatus Omnitrophica bacterium]|nr:imidazole glycerol phosphate synthase subunit HisF [Candidatus Omnitrophota bacterium]